MDKLHRRILSLAVPSIVANITTPLLSLVDTGITGHMGSPIYIGAISVGGVMFNMIYWLFGFLRAGTSGISAQAYGASDTEQQSLALYRSLGVAAILGLVLVLVKIPLLDLLQWIVSADPSTSSLAGTYFSILIFGAPAVLCTFALSGWFLGMQNSRMLMISSMVINVVNIVASLMLVLGAGWKIPGVATGTLVAQWSGLAVGLIMLRRYKLVRMPLSRIFRADELKRFFRVNSDMMLRGICFIALTTWFTKMGASQGAVMLAVNTILLQFFMFFSYMMDGFAFAGEALIGRYVGAGDIEKMKNCVVSLMKWGILMALLFTVVYLMLGKPIINMLTADEEVRHAALDYLPWAVATPLAGMAAFVWDGVFVGATLTRQLVLTMVISVGVFFAVFFLSWHTMGNNGLWLAFILYLISRWVVQTVIYHTRQF